MDINKGNSRTPQELKRVVRDAKQKWHFETMSRLRFNDRSAGNQLNEIIGGCSTMQSVFDVINRVSIKNVSVLIHGESGTGKELVARAIHNLSDRSNGPLIVINCGAIPENLLEAELFGHEKGSFTGAHIQRRGKFESANHGTVFLDEVGDLSPSLQVKLLRFLQERKIERIGGREPIELDVRIIAATNKKLELEIKNANFRDDLFYRLCVININLPPLRERGEDVPLLAENFLSEFRARYDSGVRAFTTEAKIAMQKYRWPGNIRELQNKIKRAVILTDSRLISARDLGIDGYESHQKPTLKELISNLERQCVEDALFRNLGNIAGVAKELNVSRTALYDMVRKHEINVKKYRRPKPKN